MELLTEVGVSLCPMGEGLQLLLGIGIHELDVRLKKQEKAKL